jgi:hypothetical protein
MNLQVHSAILIKFVISLTVNGAAAQAIQVRGVQRMDRHSGSL